MLRRNLLQALLVAPFAFLGIKEKKILVNEELKVGDRLRGKKSFNRATIDKNDKYVEWIEIVEVEGSIISITTLNEVNIDTTQSRFSKWYMVQTDKKYHKKAGGIGRVIFYEGGQFIKIS